MEYNRKLLEEWSQMEDWGTYLDRHGGINKFSSKEGFDFLKREYLNLLRKRIFFCENILKNNEDAFINYVLARLHDEDDVDRSSETLYKRKVIYYCNQAIKLDPQIVSAWLLLAKSYEWIAIVGGSDAITHAPIQAIEKAIDCIKEAVAIEPLNKSYRDMLKGYYHQRNEEYRY